MIVCTYACECSRRRAGADTHRQTCFVGPVEIRVVQSQALPPGSQGSLLPENLYAIGQANLPLVACRLPLARTLSLLAEHRSSTDDALDTDRSGSFFAAFVPLAVKEG